MTTIVSQVSFGLVDDIPADYATNTVYHATTGIFQLSDPDWQNHANELRDLFFNIGGVTPKFGLYAGRNGTVKCYDLADRPAPGSHGPPAPVKATATYVPGDANPQSYMGPRQVACVLSFYGDRNIPRHRGHIYVGPHAATDLNTERPSDYVLGQVLTLGHGLFDVGGENIHHVIHSGKDADNVTAVTYWVDDRWDTQRRRNVKATKRSILSP